MTTEMKLSELFSDKAYVEKICSLATTEAVYEEVAGRIPGLTEEELFRFLEKVSIALTGGAADELGEDDLDNVSGGVSWEAVGAVCAVISLVIDGIEFVGGLVKSYKEKKKEKEKEKKKSRKSRRR